MKIETKQLYPDNPNVTVTSYILNDSPEMLAGQKRGGIVICPGGGYFNCSDREAEPIAMRFAGMGYHTFVVRYSVYVRAGGFESFPDISKPLPIQKETAHPQPLIDLANAVLYIKGRADEWKLDTEKIAICGFSAGGHNCAMYSVYWDKPFLMDAVGAKGEDLKVAACILGYPLTDYVYMKEFVEKEAKPLDRMFFIGSNTAFLGVPVEEAPDALWEEVSPARLVDKNCPPTFIWGTSADGLVPPAHSALMAASLAKQRIPFEIHTFEEGDHGLSTADWQTAAAMDQIQPDAAQWVSLVEKWLKKRFMPELPEKSNLEDIMPPELGAEMIEGRK